MPFRRALTLTILATATLLAACAAFRSDPPNLGPVGHVTPAKLPVMPSRPVIAILTDPEGTETTDFVVPFALLKRWGGAEVVALSPEGGPVKLMPALAIAGTTSMRAFAATHPGGADVVIVPATHRPDAPALTDFLKGQAAHGALILSICEGAATVAEAGLLDGRRATSHWYALKRLARGWPDTDWVSDRRYIFDGDRASSAGVTASIPVTLALIAQLAGPQTARRLAREVGAHDWSDRHDSTALRMDPPVLAAAAANRLAFWRHETLAIPVDDHTDALALALQADAWSRSWRATPVAVAPEGRITTSDGLVFLANPVAPPGATSRAVDGGPALIGLNRTLAAIARRYGEATARFVTQQLELPPA